jgi:dipeptidase
MSLSEAMQGEFPRTISLFRTSYSFVAQSRAFRPDVLSLLFLCQYAPDVASYSPIYISGTALAPSWTRGSMHMYSDLSGAARQP